MLSIPHRHPVILACLLVVIAWLGFLVGRWRISDKPTLDRRPEIQFRISGDSMAPTLRDGDLCRVIVAADESTKGNPTRRQFAVGDVVAVRWDDRDRIKRLAALGGDTVNQVDGRLVINGKRLDDIIAARRDRQLIRPARVPVRSEPADWKRSAGDPDWIVFHYRNPHQADRPTPPMDDYPENESVARGLNPIDRLGVRILVDQLDADSSQATPIEVAFFDVDFGNRLTQTRHRIARSRDAIPPGLRAKKLDLPKLAAERPIALRLPSDKTTSSIEVFREIEYRIATRAAANVTYPLKLAEDEVFVVGDNHPVSVDSRQLGPINHDAVLGTVINR